MEVVGLVSAIWLMNVKVRDKPTDVFLNGALLQFYFLRVNDTFNEKTRRLGFHNSINKKIK